MKTERDKIKSNQFLMETVRNKQTAFDVMQEGYGFILGYLIEDEGLSKEQVQTIKKEIIEIGRKVENLLTPQQVVEGEIIFREEKNPNLKSLEHEGVLKQIKVEVEKV